MFKIEQKLIKNVFAAVRYNSTNATRKQYIMPVRYQQRCKTLSSMRHEIYLTKLLDADKHIPIKQRWPIFTLNEVNKNKILTLQVPSYVRQR